MAKAKRGRPRKAYHGPDKGTPEVMEKRKMMAGTKGNPDKASTWLGAMKEHGFITQAQHDAGARYAELRQRHIGRPYVVTPGNEPPGQGGSDGLDPREIGLERAYDEARAALVEAGSRAKTQVDNLAIFDRAPSWLAIATRPNQPARIVQVIDASAKERDRAALIAGLNALAGA